MNFDIIAYGSGEVLHNLFNGVASLIGGNKSTLFEPLVRMGLLVGLLLITFKVIFSNQSQLVTHWMVPAFVMLNLFFTPVSTIYIKDVISKEPMYKVDNVPWGLAAFSSIMSQMSHTMTMRIESAFSQVDDFCYHKTGSFFASNVIAATKKIRIQNPELIETMREFVSQCVVYDALLGTKYTLNDLKNSDNIWELVSQNPSPARSFVFKKPGIGNRAVICTCKDGMSDLKKLLDVEVKNGFQSLSRILFPKHYESGKDLNTTNDLIKTQLPGAFNLMIGQSKQASDVLMQEMMMHATLDGIEAKSVALGNAPNPAIRRAYLQDRASQETIGAVAAQKLVSMKNVLEALIYAAFIFILPLCMLPAGWKFLKIWVELVIWIHLWPPIYGVLHGIMMMTLKSKSLAIAGGSGVTIANSLSLYDLHADMAAMASYLSLSVGAISYALIKGGSAGISQLTGPLTSTITSVGGRAADDMTSGNFNFGNVSVGGVQAYNSGFGQQNWSPSYSSGSFAQNDGLISKTTAASGDHIYSMAQSNLRTSIAGNISKNQASQEIASRAQSTLDQIQHSKQSATEKSTAGTFEFAMHHAKSDSLVEGTSDSQNVALADSSQRLISMADNFAEQNGITKQHALSLLASASGDIEGSIGSGGGKSSGAPGGSVSAKLGGSGSYNLSHTDADLYQKAVTFTNSDSFQSSLTDTKNYALENRFNESDETSRKIAQSIQAADRDVQSLTTLESQAKQIALSATNSLSWNESHGAQINQNMNDKFVNSLKEKMGEKAALDMIVHNPSLASRKAQAFSDSHTKNLSDSFHQEFDSIKNQTDNISKKSPYELDSSNYNNQMRQINRLGQNHDVDINKQPTYDKEQTKQAMQLVSEKINDDENNIQGEGKFMKKNIQYTNFGPAFINNKPLNKKSAIEKFREFQEKERSK